MQPSSEPNRDHPLRARWLRRRRRPARVPAINTAATGTVLAAAAMVVVAAGPAVAADRRVASERRAATEQSVHVDNPYLDAGGQSARGYVNSEWRAAAETTAGGSRVSGSPTAVWIDSVGMAVGYLSSRRGLQGHLELALAQGAEYVQIVVDDLPGKRCDQAGYYSDEFGINDVSRYQSEFIDQIATIESDPRYRSLRIINIVEPRWVQNLVTNAGNRTTATDACRAIAKAGTYVTAVRYAVTKLHQAGANVYTYLDAGGYHQLGWRDDFDAAVTLLADTVRGTPDGFASVDGFVTNIAGYAPLHEPYFGIDTLVAGQTVRQSRWVDWNNYVDEEPYAIAMRDALVRFGFGSGIGMVIDTSRNGWGGPKRPSGPSTSTDVSTFVDATRVDRRTLTTSWCNQVGAGLGARPTAAPRGGIDAYAWIKLPGTSDGASPKVIDESKGFDRACDPSANIGTGSRTVLTNAMPGAPMSGAWFPAAFAELMTNAYPPLQ